MLYKIVNGSVSYGGDAVLEQVDIEIKDREKDVYKRQDLLRLLFGNDRSLDVHTQIITIFARLVKDLTALRASRASRVAAFHPLVVARAALCEIFLGIMCILLRKTRDKWYNIEWSDGGADRRRRK